MCQESFHIKSSNIAGHQCSVTIYEIHETVHLKPKTLEKAVKLFFKNVPEVAQNSPSFQ